MRCCSRSTTWLGRGLAAAGIGLLLALPAGAQDGQAAVAGESAIRHAVVETVKNRMGQDADVRIEQLRFRLTEPPAPMTLVASPEPGARLARPTRFSLQWVPPAGARTLPFPGGWAIASVFVSVDHVRATRVIARGENCEAADLVSDSGEVGAVLLQRLPRLSDAVGRVALRDVVADEVLTRTVLSVRPAVVSGDVVAVRASADGVTVQGQAVAQQTGTEGDVIRVLNRESRRPLRARVLGPGRVEVLQ